MATKEMPVPALSEFETPCRSSRMTRRFLAPLSNRVLKLTPDGVHPSGAGYTDYVARKGQKATGVHPAG